MGLPYVSFAQNREDVVLARALKPWDFDGSWVDVGAGHPEYESVTHLFSALGWRGVNIEPLEAEFRLLQDERPLDTNIRCLAGAQRGEKILYEAPEFARGLSTTNVAHVNAAENSLSLTFSKSVVQVRPLNDIFEEIEIERIDFLKIDVEGDEKEVLDGLDLQRFRPRIILIESTLPNSTVQTHSIWEHLVIDSGYLFCLFDGLNRYYCVEEEPALGELLSYPACVLDHFIDSSLVAERSANSHLVAQIDALRIELREMRTWKDDAVTRFKQCEDYARSLEKAIASLRSASPE